MKSLLIARNGERKQLIARCLTASLAGTIALGPIAVLCGTAAATCPEAAKPVSCSAINGLNKPGQQLKISGCTGATGGSGTIAAPFFSPSTVHWTKGGKTTVTFDGTPLRTGVCPGGSKGYKILGGKVKSSTVAGISGSFQATFCFSGSDRISLMPKTKMIF
jgi:hypothetical protein